MRESRGTTVAHLRDLFEKYVNKDFPGLKFNEEILRKESIGATIHCFNYIDGDLEMRYMQVSGTYGIRDHVKRETLSIRYMGKEVLFRTRGYPF